jgi:transmembrane sensor
MNKERAEDLINKYLRGIATPEEEALLESWYDLTAFNRDDLQSVPDYAKIEQEILEALRKEQQPATKRLLWPRFAAVASVLLLLASGMFYYNARYSHPLQIVRKDILPGGNKAVLTLANGKKIILDTIRKGKILDIGNLTISKNDSGQVTYMAKGTLPLSAAVAYNTITTPKGGQWRVILADGTNVWLNATSEITFPETFRGAERVVSIKGEAYFEVAKDKVHPFIVRCDRQEVKVLGTHFNINDYGDEPDIKTTLIEGSVQVAADNQKVIVVPGEQVVKGTTGLTKVKLADPNEVVAWKSGLFHFDNADVKTLMRQLSRWYDIQVEYEGRVTSYKFAGELRRDMELATVLRILEQGGIHLRMEGRKLIITS